jgi:hypothetical protein
MRGIILEIEFLKEVDRRNMCGFILPAISHLKFLTPGPLSETERGDAYAPFRITNH